MTTTPATAAQTTTTAPQDTPAATARTVVDVLAARARQTPDRIAYTFHSGLELSSLTYSALDARSAALAERMREIAEPGDRILVMPTPGLEFVVAFTAALRARLVAVPTYPPANPRNASRLAQVLRDCAPTAIVADRPVLDVVGHQDAFDGLSALATVLVDASQPAERTAGARDDEAPLPEDVAFLQYTSGSTGDPKGVVVTHHNLVHNSRVIAESMELDSTSVCVSWLPPYHDMGLVGGVLQPLFSGFHAVLISPMEFLRHPLRWLQLVSRYRATVSGGPDFAFELCVRADRAGDAELDLSSWRLAFSGSEPVRPATLERFARHFRDRGFDSRSWFPCYGMAETTLFVSGGPPNREPVTLGPGAVDGADALVGCGRPHPELDVRVVDAAGDEELPAGEVGEIVVAGDSVAAGYWNGKKPEAFSLRLPGSPRLFLRTGDLGALRDGELYVTGRLKDVLIIRGRNHYPQDVEDAARRSHPLVRPNGVAAFTVPVEGEERLVVLAEMPGRGDGGVQEAVTAIRRVVAEELGLRAHAVVPLRARSLARTANGKLRRSECRRRYLDGELAELGPVGG